MGKLFHATHQSIFSGAFASAEVSSMRDSYRWFIDSRFTKLIELAGVPRVAFLAKLCEFGVETFRQTEPELASDGTRPSKGVEGFEAVFFT